MRQIYQNNCGSTLDGEGKVEEDDGFVDAKDVAPGIKADGEKV